MIDPNDIGDLITSPVLWGSIMTLVGLTVGHLVTRGSKREENELAGLKAAVEVLRAEYARLNDEVKDLRLQMDGERKRYRKLAEKFSSAVAYIQVLWVHFPEHPAPPDLIAEDMTPLPD